MLRAVNSAFSLSIFIFFPFFSVEELRAMRRAQRRAGMAYVMQLLYEYANDKNPKRVQYLVKIQVKDSLRMVRLSNFFQIIA